ncbi:MAG: hypothetical protein ACJ77Z_18515 [Thermoleophilaceae bacterium]
MRSTISPAGRTSKFELRAIDRVGNVGDTAYAAGNVPGRAPVHWKPYYAPFLRLKVKPGSLITFWGRWEFTAPIQVPEGKMIGAHGSAAA